MKPITKAVSISQSNPATTAGSVGSSTSSPVQSSPPSGGLLGLNVPVDRSKSITGKVRILPSIESQTEKESPLSRQS
jgi:hypothetical protein